MKSGLTMLAALAAMALYGQAGEPQLGPGIKLLANGKPIDVEVGHLVPTVMDWNGDGKKDLVIGQFSNGGIRLYLNEGTDAAPKFGAFTYLQAGGKTIKLSSG